MGDPWGTEGFRGGGKRLDGANRENKILGKISKIGKIKKKFPFFFFDWNIDHWKSL